MLKQLICVCVLAVLLISSRPAAATITLAGLGVEATNSAGDASGGLNFFYSSDNTTLYPAVGVTKTAPTPAAQQFVGLNIPLEMGNNTFNLNTGFNAGGYQGIILFFSGNGTSYNPAVGTARAADLSAAAPTYSLGSLVIPTAGTQIHDFTQNVAVSYSGATYFAIGTEVVRITSLTFPDGSTGTLTLNVSVPEPASLSVLGCGVVSFAAFGRRRRKQVGVI